MENIDFKVIENKIINGEKLTEEELKSCALGEVGKCINKTEGYSHRWTKDMSTIFELNNQLYCIDWQKGLTEYQENRYWEQPHKVRREEKTVTTIAVSYIAVED